MTTLLILSGEYIAADLVAEFGKIPASFIPNGVRRLYQAQIGAWGEGIAKRIVMTLPDDYAVPDFDKEILQQLRCEIFHTATSLSLDEAIVMVIREMQIEGQLLLLFGDTLVRLRSDQRGTDSFAVGQSPQLAVWASYQRTAEGISFVSRLGSDTTGVVAGFFDFSDAFSLAQCLDSSDNFLDGLNQYTKMCPLRPVRAEQWLDFGHLFSYHHARRAEFDARSFNRIEGDKMSILKTGTPARKIFAEARWYERLPVGMRLYSPQYLGFAEKPAPGYRLEYLYLPVLSELFTFSELPLTMWDVILNSCKEFLEACQQHVPNEFDVPLNFGAGFFLDIFHGKTYRRIEQFADANDLRMEREWHYQGRPQPSLKTMYAEALAMITPTTDEDIRFWHGDFHFANIFFDFRSRRIKTVDPRGMMSDGSLSLYGDHRYDIAKLGHSVIGFYDLIMSGRYHLESQPYSLSLNFGEQDRSGIIARYTELKVGNYPMVSGEVLAIIALLFMSMLPLHSDRRERQLALLANAFRLFEMARDYP